MDKHILLSIRPKYVKEIKEGIKKYEFRKKFPNTVDSNISKTIVLYCSKPTMEIIGSLKIKNHFSSDFELLMKSVNADKIYKERISNYFNDKTLCHALEISDLKIYDHPLSLKYLRENYIGFCPGQSYRYLDNKIMAELISLNGSL